MALVSQLRSAMRRRVVAVLQRHLTKPLRSYEQRIPNSLANLKEQLRTGDVILVEGDQRVSQVIRYLTQSSWSHSALYVGDDVRKGARQHRRADDTARGLAAIRQRRTAKAPRDETERQQVAAELVKFNHLAAGKFDYCRIEWANDGERPSAAVGLSTPITAAASGRPKASAA